MTNTFTFGRLAAALGLLGALATPLAAQAEGKIRVVGWASAHQRSTQLG
ncbi:hypothetical protein [Ectopseudomonas guguanensis]|nr:MULTISPECIES: hypothetical protein [Pseudomonas]